MTKTDLKDLIEPVSKDLEAFDRKQYKYLVADSYLITSVVRHIMSSRGKRLRPALLFLSSRCRRHRLVFCLSVRLDLLRC